ATSYDQQTAGMLKVLETNLRASDRNARAHSMALLDQLSNRRRLFCCWRRCIPSPTIRFS
ncbi:MAG: hypothetical protein MI861_23220, partial [Pirellulales bacterium]|nr:hypothetical protein [Pirellulales bacterium]